MEKLIRQWEDRLSWMRAKAEEVFFADDEFAENHWAALCRQWEHAILELKECLK